MALITHDDPVPTIFLLVALNASHIVLLQGNFIVRDLLYHINSWHDNIAIC